MDHDADDQKAHAQDPAPEHAQNHAPDHDPPMHDLGRRGAPDRGDHDHAAPDHDGHDHAAHNHGDHDHDASEHDRHDHDDHDAHDAHDHDDHDDHDHCAHDHVHVGLFDRLRHLITPHSHDSVDKVDAELETSRDGVRALWLSLLILGLTAALQGIVVAISGSVALLGDTLHNIADALTAVPLGFAFLLGRRPPNRRYTYGFGRAEDLAGIVVVAVITISAISAGWAAVHRLLHPSTVSHLGAVAAAAVVGFIGNEAVAQLRIRVGRRIGSAALVADGLHARADGYTSLAVLVGAGGVALGWGWADPVVGLAITLAILVVLRDAAREVYRRLMDAVDPSIVDSVEATLLETAGVLAVGSVRLRWIGHKLRAECDIVVDDQLSIVAAHHIAVDAEHRLIHAVPRLTAAVVHADPRARAGSDHHAELTDHR